MRLRQIAIASYNLNKAERLLFKELKIKTAYMDAEVEKYGLNNIVCPVGGEFLDDFQYLGALTSSVLPK